MYRTLLVEDDGPLRQLLKMELEGSGKFEVVGEAANGLEGVHRVQHPDGPIDLVLLDLMMPVMDGMTALPKMRKALPRTPIVILSMRPAVDAEAEAMRLGATAYLDKSISGTNLAKRLVQILASEPDVLEDAGSMGRLGRKGRSQVHDRTG